MDSLAEALLADADGPITTFAASDISHPYGNAVLPYELQRVIFDVRPATIGQAVLLTKQLSISHDDRFRQLIEIGAAAQGIDAAEAEARRYEHLDLYNLFGDPASPMRYPGSDVLMEPGVAGTVTGGEVSVAGETPGVEEGTAWVTLESSRDVIINALEPVDPDDPDPATVRRNWAAATDKVIASAEVAVEGGRFEAELSFDGHALPRADYRVKVYAHDGDNDSFGSAPISR